MLLHRLSMLIVLLRRGGDFAGRTAANAFEEFWPDVKRLVFHKRN